MAPSAIVALCLLALASAAPQTSDFQCSTSCNPSSKFAYAPGNTYAYQYTGRQGLSIEGVEEGSSNAEWSANVALTWVTPCDVAISVQNVAGSNIPEIQGTQIEKYPLVLAVNNGVVENTCSHPADDASSINVKKAIASALQNSLPSIAPTSEMQIIKEDDVVGTCPTQYTISAEDGKTVVTKEKIHSECQDSTLLPMYDSRSKCSQEITNGIYSTIACKDTKVITPGYGIFKYVTAVQEFTLQFISESSDTSIISNLQGVALKYQTMKHENNIPIKNPAIVPKVDELMTKICTLSQGQSNEEVAALVSQAIELLRFAPDDAVVEVLDKIRAGQYGAEYTHLESLFLDAVAFVGEPGAFKVMAQEIAAGRTTGGRFSLYTVAVNLLTKPTLNHVAALTPIFGMAESNQILSLAASTVVNRYCTQNANCDQTAPVKEILNVLSAKLNTQCTPDFSNVKTTQVLTTLKSIGNIGKATTDLFESVKKCALTEGIETNVRFASTMSLRGVTCTEPMTKGLKSVVLDSTMNTEVRIGSYLAAIRCATAVDLEEVINQMSSESNKQVQGFILSHLANLKVTNWPLKQTLNEILSTKNVPSTYLSNIFKYSRNIEMSYVTPIVEVGGMLDSNIVYAPESYVPRFVNLGLNMNLLGSFLNIGEVGARVEGLDTYFEDALGPNSYLYKEVFGPDSYLYKTPLWTIVEDSKLFATSTGEQLIQLIKNVIKEKNINIDTLWTIVEDSKLFATSTGEQLIQLIKNVIKEKNINIDTIVEELEKIMKLSKNINIDSVTTIINQLLEVYKSIDVQALIKSMDIESVIKSIDVQDLIKSIDIDSVIKNIDVQALIKSVDVDSVINAVVNFLKTKNIELPRTDLYAILRNQERAFLSFGGKQNKFTVNDLVESITPVIMEVLLGAKDFNIDTMRTGQLNFDYTIPTISGIPLKVKLTGTAVAGIKMNHNLDAKKSAIAALLKIIPSFNTQVEAQIGFGELLNTGLKLRNSAYTTNGFSLNVGLKNGEDLELELELPEKMEFFDIHSEVILMNLDKAANEVKLFPSKMEDVRIESNQCSDIIEPVTGLLVCHTMSVPDLVNSNSLPLGKPIIARVYLQKSDVAMKGYRLAAKLRNKPEKKVLKIVVGTYGAANSKESALKLSYTKEQDTHIAALNIQSTLIKSTTEMTFINQPEYQSLQMYSNQKLDSFAPVEGSVKVDFKPVIVSNGKTYEVSTYAGLTKSLDEKHRLFQMMLSLVENGDMNTAKFVTKTDLFPSLFEVEVDMPKNAGLRVYKVDKITVRSTVSTVVVESSFFKKSPEVFQTSLIVLNSESILINLDAVHTISIDSLLIGGAANKINLMTSVNGKIPNAEFEFASKLNYENGVLVVVIGDSEVLEFNSKLTFINGALEASNGIKFYNSELVLLNSKLIYDNSVVEFTSMATYLGATIFSAKLQQTLDINNLAFMAEIDVPMVKSGMRSKWSCSNLVLESSSVALYSGSEVVVINSKLGYADGVIETSVVALYSGAEIVAMNSKLGYANGVIETSVVALYSGAEVVAINSKLGYADGVIETSVVATYSGAEIVAMNSNLGYVNGVVEISSRAKYFETEIFYANVQQTMTLLPFIFKAEVNIPSVFTVNLQQTIDSTAVTTVAQIDIPAVIKSLKINHVFGINSAFSYHLLTDVNSGGSVLLHIEGPLTFAFSKAMIKQNLDLKISGAFDGTFKIMHGITMSQNKILYTVDMRHGSTPIVVIEFDLGVSGEKGIEVKSMVNLPFVIESDVAVAITTSLVHSTMNTLALPSTPYARRFKGYADFNWVENNFKGDLYLDAERDNDMKIGLTTKYALDTTALKFIIQGDLTVTSLIFGYKLESVVASPFEWFQGVSGMEFTVTMPSKQIAVAKSMLDIQYTESQVALTPMIAFITISGNTYELTTSVVMQKLPVFLNFVITSETKLATPQLKQIALVTSIIHEDKDQTEKIAFNMRLEESVLSEAISFEYVVLAQVSEFSTIVSVMKGSNVATLSSAILLKSGVKAFEITNELSMPFIGLNSLVTKLTKSEEGTTSVALIKNQEMIVGVYYSMPSVTSHIVGIEFPSRILEFSAVFAKNQISFKVFPEKNKSAKVVETTLRLISKSGLAKFEACVTAPSLSKEMRFAVELELIEAIKDTHDMVSIDVQYQVSEAPKLLEATLNELKNIYLDLVKDGLCPNLNELYRKVQEVVKQIPKYLNLMKDELTTYIPKYYGLVKTYIMDLYKLHEADIIAMWNTARTELWTYWKIVKAEAPELVNKYVDILKKTEAWNVVQALLNELLVNYPAYLDVAVDFYNKVVVTYAAELTDMVEKVVFLPEFDVSQYVAILKEGGSTIVKNVVTELLDTKIVKLMQEKVTELKALYPFEFGLVEDVYTTVILPTSTEVVVIVNKMLAISDFDYQKYWNVIISDVPELFNKLSQRILATQIVNKLRAAYPTLFIITEDIYSNVILPVMNDMVAFIKKVTTLPVDFQEYWTVTKVEVPVIASRLVQSILDTQLVKQLKESFPTVFEISEDLYVKVIISTFEDILVLAEKLIAFPVVDFQETIKQYWGFIKAEVPPMFSKFVQRLPDTKLVQMLKTLNPMVFEISDDFYTRIIVPTASDIVTVVEKLITLPLSDIQGAAQQCLNILKVEMPTLMGKFFERLPETQIVMLIKEKSTEVLLVLQEKLAVLETQYPVVYATAIDFYNKVAVPACSDLTVIYGKLTMISDIYQVLDLVKTEVMVLISNIVKNVSTTELMNIIISKSNELVALYPEEYKFVLGIYNQVSQITLSSILATVNTYIKEELGITYSISAEKFTAVFPLPVSMATVHNYYHIITVYAPAYVSDVVALWLVQGRVLYKSIQAQIPVIVDYINTQAPIYVQYIKNYLEKLQVIIPEYIEKIQADLPEFVKQLQEFLFPYLEEIKITVVTYVEFAKNSVYGKLVEKKVEEIVKLFITKMDEIMTMYPEEYQAILDFVSVYMNICLEYATWAINTIVEYPTVKKAIEYIVTFTPEKAQAIMDIIVEYVMSTISQLEAIVNGLIAAIPKDIPAFIEMHVPAFIISFITTILSYLN